MREESARETFNFLGFTHYWGRTRTGGWSPKLKTEGKRLGRKLQEIGEWCRKNRHRPISEQQAELWQKVSGHIGLLWSEPQHARPPPLRAGSAVYWAQVVEPERFTQKDHSVYPANPLQSPAYPIPLKNAGWHPAAPAPVRSGSSSSMKSGSSSSTGSIILWEDAPSMAAIRAWKSLNSMSSKRPS